MIKNDQELQATLERIRYFQQQVEKLRQVETNPTNYRLSASGYLTEIDRMHLAVREYLWLHPSEVTAQALPGPTLAWSMGVGKSLTPILRRIKHWSRPRQWQPVP